MATTWQTVRVFISSTFRDMHAERDHLLKIVFPALRERLEKHRVYLIDIDLRWGITREQAENDRVLDLCLQQIEECRPFFLGILGERYGWVPTRYPADALKRYGWIQHHTGKSITELEILHGVLQNPKMHGHAFFYFRDSTCLQAVPETQRRSVYAETDATLIEKLAELKKRIRSSGLPVMENYPARWNPEAYNRESKSQGRLVGLEEFGWQVQQQLWGAIRAELKLDESPPTAAVDLLAEENDFHERFMESRLRVYVGREAVQEKLLRFATGSDAAPCLVTGPSGSGKSAVLAWFVKTCGQKHPDVFALPHFVGASPRSTGLRNLLHRLCQSLKNQFNLPDKVPEETAQLIVTFRDLLGRIPPDRRVLIVIDAVNQLDETERAQHLEWLPANLLPQVKIVLSCILDNGKIEPALEAFRQRPHQQFELQPLNDTERRAIIRNVPSLSAKTLDENQIALLLANPATANPLFLLVALEELRGFGSYEQLADRIDNLPRKGDTVTAVFQQVIERLEEDFTGEQVQVVLTLLASARHGLSERELLDLVEGPDTEIRTSKSDLFPILRQLRPYLLSRDGLLDFYHRNLFKAVRDRYLATTEKQHAGHSCLADYFVGRAQGSNPDKKWATLAVRGFAESVFHLIRSGQHQSAAHLLSDFPFLLNKVRVGLLEGVFEDYDVFRDEAPSEQARCVDIWRTFFREKAHILRRGSNDWPSYKILLQLAVAHADDSSVTQQAAAWEAEQSKLWPRVVTCIRPTCISVESCLRVIVPRSQSKASSAWPIMALAVLPDGHLALAMADGTVRFWNPFSQSETSYIQAHRHEVGALAILPGGFLITESRRELALWQIDGFTEVARIDASEPCNVLTVLSDGRLVSAASIPGGGPIKVWDIARTTPEVTQRMGWLDVNALAALPSGDVVSASRDGSVRVWRVDTGAELVSLKENPDGYYRDGVRALTVLRDGRLVYDGGYSVLSNTSTIKLWDPSCEFAQRSIRIHGGKIEDITVMSDGRLALALDDYTVRAIDVRSDADSVTMIGHTNTITALIELPDKLLASASYDGTVRVWDLQRAVLAAATVSRERKSKEGPVTALAVVSDGRIVAGHSNGPFHLLDPKDRKVLLEGHGDWVSSITVLSNSCVVSGAEHARHPGRVYLWNYARPDLDGNWWIPSGVLGLGIEAPSVVGLPKGRLISGRYDGSLILWNVTEGTEIMRMKGDESSVRCLAVLNDERVASGHFNGKIQVWDIDADSKITLAGHDASVNSMVVLPEGSLVSASSDGSVRIWDANHGNEKRSIKGHVGAILGLALTSAGLLMCGGGGALSLVNLETGEEIARYLHDAAFTAVAVLQDRRSFVAGDETGRLHWLEYAD